MIKVVYTENFSDWLNAIKDSSTRFRLIRRIERLQRGHLGDVKKVGDDLYEMREFFGPGWRMYYLQHAKTIVVMLGGGDKKSQAEDIKLAKKIAKELRE